MDVIWISVGIAKVSSRKSILICTPSPHHPNSVWLCLFAYSLTALDINHLYHPLNGRWYSDVFICIFLIMDKVENTRYWGNFKVMKFWLFTCPWIWQSVLLVWSIPAEQVTPNRMRWSRELVKHKSSWGLRVNPNQGEAGRCLNLMNDGWGLHA